MPLPPGLTDITVRIPTQEEQRLADQAASRKDWREYNKWRSAVVLHFGKRRVYIPAGKYVIDELRRAVIDGEGDLRITGGRFDQPKTRKERLNLWERIVENLGQDEETGGVT